MEKNFSPNRKVEQSEKKNQIWQSNCEEDELTDDSFSCTSLITNCQTQTIKPEYELSNPNKLSNTNNIQQSFPLRQLSLFGWSASWEKQTQNLENKHIKNCKQLNILKQSIVEITCLSCLRCWGCICSFWILLWFYCVHILPKFMQEV